MLTHMHRFIVDRVLIFTTVWAGIFVWNGWFGLPFWLMGVIVPAYAGISYFILFPMLQHLWATIIVTKESFSWGYDESIADMSLKEQLKNIHARKTARVEEIMRQWKEN